MINIQWRILTKCSFFLGFFLFIFFFVVYGYRFNNTISGIVKENIHINFSFWSNNHSVSVNQKKYKPFGQQLTLYNLEAGCHMFGIDGQEINLCLSENTFHEEVRIAIKGEKILGSSIQDHACEPFESLEQTPNCIRKSCFSEGIVHAFIANKRSFIQTPSSLSVCNSQITSCKEITSITGKAACWENRGIIFRKNNQYILLELE